MGFFDSKQYLTGENGLISPGDSFVIHGARISGEIRNRDAGKPGEPDMLNEAEFLVSKTRQDAPIKAYTTGRAIVQQVERMDPNTDPPFPWDVVLTSKPLDGGRTMNVIERAVVQGTPVPASADQTPPNA